MIALADQTAVVTGASSGVGKAIALRLAAEGASVCLVGRELATLEAVAASARATAPRIQCYQADLSLDDQIHHLTTRIKGDLRHVDLLIHSAGVISLGQVQDAPVEDLDRHYRTNLRAPYVLTQALLPLIRVGKGQIVFINSSVGLNARASTGQYAATKHGLRAVADSLREEVNRDGVRVLSVFLGRTASPMQAFVHEQEGREYRAEHLIQPEDVAARLVTAIRLPRSTEVTDMSIRPSAKLP